MIRASGTPDVNVPTLRHAYAWCIGPVGVPPAADRMTAQLHAARTVTGESGAPEGAAGAEGASPPRNLSGPCTVAARQLWKAARPPGTTGAQGPPTVQAGASRRKDPGPEPVPRRTTDRQNSQVDAVRQVAHGVR